MPRTFLVRRTELEIDNTQLISSETDTAECVQKEIDKERTSPAADLRITDELTASMFWTSRDRNLTNVPAFRSHCAESKAFIDLDTGNIERKDSPLDMLANAALNISPSTNIESCSAKSTHALKPFSKCIAKETETSKSPRKMKASGKENSPRKSAKKNHSLPSFASLAYNTVLSSQASNTNNTNDVSSETASARHVMPPVTSRKLFPVARRRLPIQSPSFKVWNEVKPASVIHPSSPFLRSIQENMDKVTDGPKPKRAKKMLRICQDDVKETTVVNKSVLKPRCQIENFMSNETKEIESTKKEQKEVLCTSEAERNNNVPSEAENTIDSCSLNAKSNTSEHFRQENLDTKIVPVKKESEFEQKQSEQVCAKPKIWNPLFHEPKLSAKIPDEGIANQQPTVQNVFLKIEPECPNIQLTPVTSTANSTVSPYDSCAEKESTDPVTKIKVSKPLLHKFSIDSILSNDNERKDPAVKTDSKPVTVLKSNEAPHLPLSALPSQQFSRNSVIVATSSARPSNLQTAAVNRNVIADNKRNPVSLTNSTSAQFKQVFLTNVLSNVTNAVNVQSNSITSSQRQCSTEKNISNIVRVAQLPSPIVFRSSPMCSPVVSSLRPQSASKARLGTWQTPGVVRQVSPVIKPDPDTTPPLQTAHNTIQPTAQTPTQVSFIQPQPNQAIVVYDENKMKMPLSLGTNVELVNGGFGVKNPSFRPPKPSDITNVQQDPITGSGKYACTICKKEFALQRLLNRHLKCHSESKRFLCTFCGKGFNDTFDLKRHTRIHTGVKPYKCSECERSFTQRCSLESHCRKVHNADISYAYKQRRSKIYVCEECGHTTDDPESHFVHLRENHPNNPALSKCHDKRQFKFNEETRQGISLMRT